MNLKLPVNIEYLLRQRTVEGERIEYKAGWNPDATIKTICAFANDFHNLGGGYIIIGVAEKNGRPVLPPKGLPPESIDGIQKEILNLGHNAIQPHYHPISASYVVEGRTILILSVPGGEVRPYKVRTSISKKSSEWAYYIRKQASTVRATGNDERELLGLAATVPFDDRYNQNATLEDISTQLVKEFLRKVGSDLAEDVAALPREELGRRMNIVGGPSESLFPKNVGLLFFNEEPHRFFPATQIDVVWFPEGAGGDRFEEKVFRGPLAQITRDAIAFIERSYVKETVIKHPERPEAERFWNFPVDAIEEAVVNAVYHRSYQEREPVEVRITADDLVVLSFPGPDRSIKMEALRGGKAVSRRYRNRRIGEFLKELELTEGRSTGIPKIFKAMAANGSPVPEFDTDEDRSYFITRLPIHPKAVGIQPSGAQSRVQSGAQSVMVMSALIQKPLSMNELVMALGLKSKTGSLKRTVSELLSQELIEYTVPEKPSSRLQKYRMTSKGKTWLKKLGDNKE
jgi:ATP-dependent DNA helicase RecG